MIEKTLRTARGKLRVKIPTQLNELTLGQLMAMQDNATLNDLEALSILSGIALDELNNVKSMADLAVFTDHVQSLAHQIKYLYNSDAVPSKVIFTIDEQKVRVKVTHNLAVEPAGAFMAAREIIADEISEHIKQYGEEDWQEHFRPSLKACCQVLAHYFYCRATGKPYSEHEAEKFTEQIKKLRVTEALPISKHFFLSYPGLSKPRTNCWHRLLQYWKKKPASTLSKNLNISIQ